MNKQVVKSEYEIQAENFLQKHGIAFSARFLYHGPHWEGDKDTRDVYELTLSKGTGKGQQLDVKFGQSIANSGEYVRKLGSQKLVPSNQIGDKSAIAPHNYHIKSDDRLMDYGFRYVAVKRQAPTAYDLLACLTKYDPMSFEDFCSEFGCDTDSRKAERTYNAVREEWYKVNRFFTKQQLEELQDIQ